MKTEVPKEQEERKKGGAMSTKAVVAVSGIVAFGISIVLKFVMDFPKPPELSDWTVYQAWWAIGTVSGATLACMIIFRRTYDGKLVWRSHDFLVAGAAILVLVVSFMIYESLRLDAENYQILTPFSYFSTIASFAFVASFGFPAARKIFDV